MHVILARGAIVSPQVELYFRETARIDGDPGRVIPTCQSEVAHTGESTIAAGGGSTEGLGSANLDRPLSKWKASKPSLSIAWLVFRVGEWLLMCSVRSVKRDTAIVKYVRSTEYIV